MTPDAPLPNGSQPPMSTDLPSAIPPSGATPAFAPPQPNAYPYWLPQAPVKREYPTPPARIVPTAWMVTLVALTVAAVALAIGGALSVRVPASPFHTTAYSNNLAQNDNAWQFHNTAGEVCKYAKGGLDARDSVAGLLASPCRLSQTDIGDMRLSVRVLPEANLDYPLRPVIFVHSAVAIAFSPDTGSFTVLAPPAGSILSSNGPINIQAIYVGQTDQWYTDGFLSNTIMVQVQNGIYTIAINGAQVYSGDFNGAAESLPTTGGIRLGAWLSDTDSSATSEAAYADFTLTTP